MSELFYQSGYGAGTAVFTAFGYIYSLTLILSISALLWGYHAGVTERHNRVMRAGLYTFVTCAIILILAIMIGVFIE